ncbi:MAG: imidazoleglycerol-phosphate dehydratase [Candidatus Thermoplasmatota archaeon]
MTRNAVTVRRSSKETSATVRLLLRGSGRFEGDAGDVLLTHLLETFARYAGLDLRIEAKGDERHHVGEDIAHTIGRALRRALPDAGVARFGEATVPMDEALVQVVIDLVDRPYYRSDLPPSSMAEHVLRSLLTEARVTFHQRTLREGEAHHVLEATFKALGLALVRALEPSDRGFSLKGKVEWEESP